MLQMELLQELQEENTELKAKVVALQTENAALKEKNIALKVKLADFEAESTIPPSNQQVISQELYFAKSFLGDTMLLSVCDIILLCFHHSYFHSYPHLPPSFFAFHSFCTCSLMQEKGWP